MLTVKYTWRELTQNGLLKRIHLRYSYREEYFDNEYDSEEQALKAFEQEFKNEYECPTFVLVKLYGNDPNELSNTRPN